MGYDETEYSLPDSCMLQFVVNGPVDSVFSVCDGPQDHLRQELDARTLLS